MGRITWNLVFKGLEINMNYLQQTSLFIKPPLVYSKRKDPREIHNFDSLRTLVITATIHSAMRSMVSYVKTCLPLFITLRTNIRMSIIPLIMFVFVFSPFRMSL